jgi:DNA-binding transcriptional MerR regulator
MFRIGDFSRLSQVSIKTLHHYDEIGLFQSAHVDPWTGYRYYTMEQLPRLNRILALRGLGFSLEQIRQIVGNDLSAEELRGMLMLRRAQLQQQMEETREMLAQVEIRLQQIEQEGIMSEFEILTKDVAPLTVAGARQIVTTPEQMRERCMALEVEARHLVETQALKTDGVSLAIYHSGGDEGIDVEMAYVVEPPTCPAAKLGQAEVHQLPAATVAYAVYHGSYDDFGAVGQIHGAIHRWSQDNDYRIAGPSREFYLQPPQDWTNPIGVMEIQYPILRR